MKIATEDGSAGIRGNVVDLLRALPEKPKAILSCGPLPMLRALKAYAAEEGIPLWVSMEERMACGIGACLGCITESAEVDAHSNVKTSASVPTDRYFAQRRWCFEHLNGSESCGNHPQKIP